MDFEVQLKQWTESVVSGELEASKHALAAIQTLSESDQKGGRACTVACIGIAESHGATALQLDALLTWLSIEAASADIAQCRAVLQKMVPVCALLRPAYAAAMNFMEILRTSVFPQTPADQVPHLLALALDITDPLDDPEITVELLRVAAITYGDHGSFQPAYGALSDAEQLAHRQKRADLLARVLSTMHCVCILEADHEYANKIWPIIEDVYKALGTPVPTGDLANRATCLMRMGRYPEAVKAFDEVLDGPKTDAPTSLFAIYGNLAACLRESGDLERAQLAMGQAWALLEGADPSQIRFDEVLELNLIDAKTACTTGDLPWALRCLQDAAALLDEMVAGTIKLHYRREVRER